MTVTLKIVRKCGLSVSKVIFPGPNCNSRELKAHCAIDDTTLEVLKFAMADLHLGARAYDRILKVARTIADLAGSENILSDHISEAIQYRSLDRQIWT